MSKIRLWHPKAVPNPWILTTSIFAPKSWKSPPPPPPLPKQTTLVTLRATKQGSSELEVLQNQTSSICMVLWIKQIRGRPNSLKSRNTIEKSSFWEKNVHVLCFITKKLNLPVSWTFLIHCWSSLDSEKRKCLLKMFYTLYIRNTNNLCSCPSFLLTVQRSTGGRGRGVTFKIDLQEGTQKDNNKTYLIL